MSGVLLGVTLPQFTGDAARFWSGVQRAEAAGVDSLWLFDHLWPLSGGKERSIIECWTALAWLGAKTEHLQVGSLVTRSSLRHPALLAKMAATVGMVAPGRVTVGIGSGDELTRSENEAFGLPYLAGEARLAQLRATVETVARYLHEDELTVRDDHVALSALPPSPRPAPVPRLWVGGRSEGVLEVAAAWADGWNAWACSPEAFAADATQLIEAAGGRPIELSWGGLVALGSDDADAKARLGSRDPERWVVGGPDTVAAHLSGLVDIGARHLILTLSHPGDPEVYAALGEVRRLVTEEVP